jgi:hypothetical protein
MRDLTRPQPAASPIVGPVDPLSRRRSPKVTWALRLVALVLLVVVVIALLVVLRGAL